MADDAYSLLPRAAGSEPRVAGAGVGAGAGAGAGAAVGRRAGTDSQADEEEARSRRRQRRKRKRHRSKRPKYGEFVSLEKSPRNAKDERDTLRYKLSMWRVLIGASIVALVSGTPNAFNVIQDDVQADVNGSDVFISLLGGVGQAGLFISLPAGMLSDRYGTAVTAVVGGVLTVLSYVAFSFSDSHVLLVITNALAGIGSGSTFLAALQTAIAIGDPFGIGLVSLCMSLSITGTISLRGLYNNHVCNDAVHASCWREVVRLYGFVVCGGVIIGAALLIGAGRFMNRPSPVDGSKPKPSRPDGFDEVLTMWQALKIFKSPYFLCLWVSNLVGLGSGIYVVNKFGNLWDDYRDGGTSSLQLSTVITLFSVLNAVANVISPLLGDYLHVKGRMRVNRFIAVMLAMQAAVFLLLGVLDETYRHSSVNRAGFNVTIGGVLISLSGFAYGVFLSMFPMAISDAYGFVNFGSFQSFGQLGAALLAVGLPPLATTVASSTGSYVADHYAMCGLLVLGTLAMALPQPMSNRFASEAPSRAPQPLCMCCRCPGRRRTRSSVALITSRSTEGDDENLLDGAVPDERNVEDWLDTRRRGSSRLAQSELPDHLLPATSRRPRPPSPEPV